MIAIAFFVLMAIPTFVGYVIVKIGWPKSLIEYGFNFGYSTIVTYANIGGTFLVLLLIVGLSLIGIKNLGSA